MKKHKVDNVYRLWYSYVRDLGSGGKTKKRVSRKTKKMKNAKLALSFVVDALITIAIVHLSVSQYGYNVYTLSAGIVIALVAVNLKKL